MNKQTQTAEAQTIAFYKRYTEQLLDQLAKAHEKIGGLQYHLEQNGIEVPSHLAEKKRLSAVIANINPKIFLSDFSLN